MHKSNKTDQVEHRRINRSVLSVMCVLMLGQLAMIGCTHSPNRDGADTAREHQRTLTRYTFARVMMGSRCEITIEGESEPTAARAAGLAFDEIKLIEQK